MSTQGFPGANNGTARFLPELEISGAREYPSNVGDSIFNATASPALVGQALKDFVKLCHEQMGQADSEAVGFFFENGKKIYLQADN